MPELRRLAERLTKNPLVPTPGMDAVQARAKAYRQRRQVKLAAAAVLSLLVLSAAVLPSVGDNADDGQQLRTADEGAVDDLPVDLPPQVADLTTLLPGGSTTTTAKPGPTTTAPPPPTTTTTRPNPESCPGGQNSGATDVGVTGTEIKVLVRVRQTESRYGAQALFNRVNQAGGVCGRKISVTAVVEPSQADPSQFFAVVPEYGGGIPDGIPVVGTDGLAKSEFQSGWSWPVGTPSAAQARIMALHAWDEAGARTYGIVYDNQQAFGTEAKDALTVFVQQLGGTVKASVGVTPNKANYTSEANQFAGQCPCDAVLYAVNANTALAFFRSGNTKGTKITGGLSPLVSQRFAKECESCQDMYLWSPFRPAVGENMNDQEMAEYINDVKAMSPGIDPTDQSIQRGYVAAKVLVAALDKAGANLTRARLRTALDGMTYSSAHTVPLSWDGDRIANTAAQFLVVKGSGNTFSGFANDAKFRHDPSVASTR